MDLSLRLQEVRINTGDIFLPVWIFFIEIIDLLWKAKIDGYAFIC